MLEEMVKAVVNKVIAQDYPFLKSSDYNDLVIHNDETGTSYRGHITAHWYEYTLQAVDRWGNVDESVPAFPDIRSRIQLKTGAFVSVAMAYGDVPAIIREVKL